MINRASRSSTRRSERGLSPAVELVVLLPAVLILLGVTVAGGRVWFTRSAVTEAAYSGARAASLQRDADAAADAGRQATVARLKTEGVHCVTRSISIKTSGFDAAVGEAAAVTTRVRCRVTFGDVILPGLGGSLLLRGAASSAIDSYRER